MKSMKRQSSQVQNSPLWKDNEVFWNGLPDAPTSAPVCRDPRVKPPITTEKELKALEPDPKMQERIKVLSEKLKMGENPTMTEIQAMMQKPEYKEMMELTQQMVNNPAMQSYVKKHEAHGKEKDQYDAKTKAWLKSSGFESISAWKGRAVALYEGIGKAGNITASGGLSQTTSVTFTTSKRYYDRSSGRQVWSGGYTLAAQVDGFETKKYERPNPAMLQFFIGQEGYFLKYAGASMGTEQIPLYQPFISTYLFNLDKLKNLPLILMSPGDKLTLAPDSPILLGFPFSNTSGSSSKKLTGRLRLILPDKSIYRIGWELSPV
jgi:hypothetical protein